MTVLEVVDRSGDVLGLWSPDQRPPAVAADEVRLRLSGRPDLVTDLLGIPAAGLRRDLPVRAQVTLVVDVLATEAPAAALSTRLVLFGSGLVTSELWCGDPDAGPSSDDVVADHDPMAVEAPYYSLLRWLHRDMTFGNMLWSGCRAKGDWMGFGAMAGIIQARAQVAEVDVIDALLLLADPEEWS